MNVLYVLHSVDVQEGASKAILHLLEGLVVKGVKPYVVLPRRAGLFHVLSAMGVEVVASPVRANVYPRFDSFKNCMLFIPRLVYWHTLNEYTYLKLSRLFKGKDIDIVHTNVSIVNVGRRLAKRLKAPHILHIREYFDVGLGKRYFPSKGAFRAMCVSPGCHTICITRNIQRHFRLDGVATSAVIYDGVCAPLVATSDADKERYFLYVGKIYHVKGLLELVKAYCEYLRLAKSDAVPLLVAGGIGDVVYYEKVVAFLQKHDAARHVTFLGQRDDVPELMRHALATVIPSLFEGFGFCMVEAMLNGSLVIGHNTGGTKEQFDNGKELCGEEIGIRYDTEAQLTSCLLEVAIHSPGHYERMTRMAAETVRQLYSVESHVDNVHCLYESILAGRRLRG